MNKLMKRIVSLSLMLLMTAGLTATPALAASTINYATSKTVYLSGTGTTDYSYAYLSISNRASATKKISSVKSSSTSVASIESYSNSKSSYGSETTDYYSGKANVSNYNSSDYSSNINLKCKKAGTSNITFKYDSKTYTTKLTVKSYVNPVKTATITGINSGNSIASKTKSKNYSTFKLSKDASSAKIKVTANTGWKITGISCDTYKSTATSYTDYGSYSRNMYSSPLTSATLSVGTLKASRSHYISVTFTNTSNHASQTITYAINN